MKAALEKAGVMKKAGSSKAASRVAETALASPLSFAVAMQRFEHARTVYSGRKLAIRELAAYGMSPSTIYRWCQRGDLRRTNQRGVYMATARTRRALLAYLQKHGHKEPPWR